LAPSRTSWLVKYRPKASSCKKRINCCKEAGGHVQLATQRKRSKFKKAQVLHGNLGVGLRTKRAIRTTTITVMSTIREHEVITHRNSH
jgi:hypothetical protein